MLEYYLGIDVSGLSDDEWVRKIAALTEVRRKEKMGEPEVFIQYRVTEDTKDTEDNDLKI